MKINRTFILKNNSSCTGIILKRINLYNIYYHIEYDDNTPIVGERGNASAMTRNSVARLSVNVLSLRNYIQRETGTIRVRPTRELHL